MPRKPDPDARRNLLAAARAAFAEVGVGKARVEDVARAAGLSKGAFYLHFYSKEEAFREIVSDFFAVMRDLVEQRHEACRDLRATVGSPSAEDWRTDSELLRKWRACDHAHTVRALQALWRHRDVLRAVLEHGEGARLGLVDPFVDLSREMLAAQLQQSIDAGALRDDLPAELVSELIIGMWLQLARRMTRASTRPDFDLWARAVDTLMVEGLAARTADRTVSKGCA
ncbi:MAG: TetR/AcrR family transcriptional regulator [Myxococcota bacterium]